jgi:pilus assembly protein CpaD
MTARARKDSLKMNRIRSAPALLALGLSLGACAGADYAPGANRTLYSVNQPVVQRTDYVIDLAAQNGLSPQERQRLGAWFDSLQIGYGDRVSVDQPHGYGDVQARRDVASVAGDYGLLLAEGAPLTAGTVQPGSVRVIVSRTVASMPNCPNWDYANEPGAPVATSPNYGCALNGNMAAMIADPNDLVLGQSGSLSGAGATATKAIRTHRNAVPTGARGLEETSSRGGQ